MQPCGDNCMGCGVLTQQRVGISVEPEGFGGNRLAEGGILPISVAEHPNIVAVLLEYFVEILPAFRELLESPLARNAPASNPLHCVARGRWNKYEVRSLLCRFDIPEFTRPNRGAWEVAVRYIERIQQGMCVGVADGEAETGFNPLANNPLCLFTLGAVCHILLDTDVRMRKTCSARHCKDFQSPADDKVAPHRVVVPMLPVVVIVVLRHPTIDEKRSVPNDILIVTETPRTEPINQYPHLRSQHLFKQILKSHSDKGVTRIIVCSSSCSYQGNVCHYHEM